MFALAHNTNDLTMDNKSTNGTVSSINLCPINFQQLEIMNQKLRDMSSIVILSKLKFHQINSKIHKEGKTWIIRSRKQIAEWFNLGLKKIDKILSFLEKNGLITKKLGLWYGKKRLFISVSEEITHIFINHQLFKTLIDETGSLISALVLSKIAFCFANSKIHHEGKKWCCIKKENLCQWAEISIRTLDKIIDGLSRKGLLLKKNFVWNERTQTHFYIPNYAIEVLKNSSAIKEVKLDAITKDSLSSKNSKASKKPNSTAAQPTTHSLQDTKTVSSHEVNLHPTAPNNYQEFATFQEITSSPFCRPQPVKKELSIKISNKQKENNNINANKLSTNTNDDAHRGDINFDIINTNLSNRQARYIEKALLNTVTRKKINISCPSQVIEEVKFSILNIHQHKTIKSFKHCVSRCMKIIGDGNWKTPFGFHKHSSEGRGIKNNFVEKEKLWEEQKKQEIENHCTFEKGVKYFTYKKDTQNTTLLAKATTIVGQLSQAFHALLDEQNLEKITSYYLDELEKTIKMGADKEAIRQILYSTNLFDMIENSKC